MLRGEIDVMVGLTGLGVGWLRSLMMVRIGACFRWAVLGFVVAQFGCAGLGMRVGVGAVERDIGVVAVRGVVGEISKGLVSDAVYCVLFRDADGTRSDVDGDVLRVLDDGEHLVAMQQECRQNARLAASSGRWIRPVFVEFGPIQRAGDGAALVEFVYGCGGDCGGRGVVRLCSVSGNWVLDRVDMQEL
jgi:hypothetical protein